MNRSEINLIIRDAKAFLDKKQFRLPPWAGWGLTEWNKNKDKAREVIENMLGWDITDFGSGDFNSRGLFLFTLRNGRYNSDAKPYAEKIMIVGENQETPLHYHQSKIEDIINRGGGNLVIELYNAGDDGHPDRSGQVSFKIDGISRVTFPGEPVILTPGESICLIQGMYHRFYGEPGKGKVLVGEVSAVNDDNSDNYFHESLGRFPAITEDEEPLHLLVSDYGKFL
jgi:D-lyxose ketol-isomerase